MIIALLLPWIVQSVWIDIVTNSPLEYQIFSVASFNCTPAPYTNTDCLGGIYVRSYAKLIINAGGGNTCYWEHHLICDLIVPLSVEQTEYKLGAWQPQAYLNTTLRNQTGTLFGSLVVHCDPPVLPVCSDGKDPILYWKQNSPYFEIPTGGGATTRLIGCCATLIHKLCAL